MTRLQMKDYLWQAMHSSTEARAGSDMNDWPGEKGGRAARRVEPDNAGLRLPANANAKEALAEDARINRDSQVCGCMVILIPLDQIKSCESKMMM